MIYLLMTPVCVQTAIGDNGDRCDTDTSVCTDGCIIGLERDHCDIYGIDTDTDGCKLRLEGDHCDRCDVHTAVKYD